jgi:hypothetical protein
MRGVLIIQVYRIITSPSLIKALLYAYELNQGMFIHAPSMAPPPTRKLGPPMPSCLSSLGRQ